MLHHPIAANCVVALTDGKRVASTRRRQRLEAKMGEQSRRTGVKRVRDDEGTVALVKRTKRRSFLCLGQHFMPRPTHYRNVAR